MNILVTGASGFIGSRVVTELIGTGNEVHAVARTQPADASGVMWHQLDLFDSAAVAALVDRVRPTHVIHLAWEARPGIFPSAPENLDWVGASLFLLRRVVETGGTSFVAAGSCFELLDTTLYGRAKSAFRSVAERYCVDRRVRFASGRIFFPYGVGEPRGKFASMIFEKVRDGDKVELREPDRRLDFIHVDDVARAFVAINRSDDTGIFDIGTGNAPSIREFARTAAAIAGDDAGACLVESSAIASTDLVANVEKLTALGWAPRISLYDGLLGLLRGGKW